VTAERRIIAREL